MEGSMFEAPRWLWVDRHILQLYLAKHSSLFSQERARPMFLAFNRWVEYFKVDSRNIGMHFWNRFQKLHYWMVLRALSRQGRHEAESLLLHAVSKHVQRGLAWERETRLHFERSRARFSELFRNGPFSVSSPSTVVIADEDEDNVSTE